MTSLAYRQSSSIKIPALMTSLPYLDEMECAICLLQHPASQFVSLLKCRCAFCACCLEQYLTILILEAKVENIPCPNTACNRKGCFVGKEISSLVRPEIFLQFLFLKQTFDVENDPFRVMCPVEDCQAICHLCSGTGDTYSQSQGQPVTCFQCGTVFCSKCKALWHKDMPCDRLVERWRRRNDVSSSSWASGDSSLLGASSSPSSAHAASTPLTAAPSGALSTASSSSSGVVLGGVTSASWVRTEKTLSATSSQHSVAASAEAFFMSRRKNSAATTLEVGRGGRGVVSSYHALSPPPTNAMSGKTKNSDKSRQRGVKSEGGSSMEDETKKIRGAGILADINVKQCSNCLLLLEPRDSSSLAAEVLTICRRCRHVFCSFCRLDISPDFMLRHFDDGECRERWLSTRPSTSKAALIWIRTQSSVIKGLNNLLSSPLRGASFIIDFLNKTKPQSKSSFYETLDAYIEQELQWLVDSFFWKLKTRVLVMDLSQIHRRVIRSLLFKHGKYLVYSDLPRQRSAGSKRDMSEVESRESFATENDSKCDLVPAEFSHRDCVILSWISLLDEWTLLPEIGGHQGLGVLFSKDTNWDISMMAALEDAGSVENYDRQEEKLRIAKLVKYFEDFGVVVLAELKKRRLVLKKDHNVIDSPM